jgi:hypothetical protein
LVEDEWLIAAHDRAPSHDGGSMWFMLAIRCTALCETGRAIRGKWKIPNRNVGNGFFHIQSSEGGSPCLCRLRTDRLTPVNKIDYVLMHMGSHKLSSFDGR